MLKFSIEKIKQVEDEHYFKVSALCSSKTKKHYAYQKNVVKQIVEKYNIEEYDFISSKSSGDLNRFSDNGVYVFRIEEKPIDIQKESVRIVPQKVEAAPVTVKKVIVEVEEPKKEASLPSEPLPYGLKSTAVIKAKPKPKAKKKRAAKNKTTEE